MALIASLRATVLGALLVLGVVASSCSSSEADGQVLQVRPQRAVELISSGDYVVLDLRPLRAYEAGHVEEAVHVPFHEADFEQRLEDLDPETDYLVYSRSGEVSARAADVMVANGFDKVVDAGPFGTLAIAGAPILKE